MSYRQLGQIPGNLLARSGRTGTTVVPLPSGPSRSSGGFALTAFLDRQRAGMTKPVVPPGCSADELPNLTLPKPGARKFNRAPKNLQPDQLYVSMMPAPKGAKLTPEMKAQVVRYFRERMDPIYAHYPVRVAHVCTRRGPAGHCYNHQSAQGKPHMEPDHAMERFHDNKDAAPPISPYNPSFYAGKNPDNLAHHWISIFSLLRDWWKLPHGWMNVAGREVFYWCPVPNARSHYAYIDADGNQPFTDRRVEAEPISQYSTKVFMDALKQVGASTVDWNERWYLTPDGPMEKAVPPLIYTVDQVPGDKPSEWVRYTLLRGPLELGYAMWLSLAEKASREGQPAPDPQSSNNGAIRTYAQVLGGIVGLLNYALDQNKTLRIWTLFKEWWDGGPKATIVNGFQRESEKATEAVGLVTSAVASVGAAGQAPEVPSRLLAAIGETPDDPAAQMVVAEGTESQLNALIQAIQGGPMGAQYLAQHLASYQREENFIGGLALYDGLQRARSVGYEGGAPLLVYQHLVCAAAKGAKDLNVQYGARYRTMASQVQDALTGWSNAGPRAQAALDAYAAALAEVQRIKATINLPWYLKKLGPMPTWGWMAGGASLFLGGAVLVRRSRRKKKVAANRRRTSRRM